jgi:hypothetical protein
LKRLPRWLLGSALVRDHGIAALAPVVCLLLVLALSGCAISHVPITAATPQPADQRMTGTWRAIIDDEEEDAELHVITALPNGRLQVTTESSHSMATQERFEVITADIGGRLYGSATLQDPEGQPPRYVLFAYEHESPDRVQIYIALLEQLEEAARLKRIAGKRVPDRHFDSFELKSDARELRAFVKAHGARIFSWKGPVLERVRK